MESSCDHTECREDVHGSAEKGLGKEFADYMMDGRPKEPSLSQWLGQHKMQREDYERWKLYEMDAGEAFVSQTARPKEIEAFVKDAYGMPYVPGSTLKGMFRTALIADEIQKCPENMKEQAGRYSLLPQNAQAGNNALQERQNV